MFPNQGFSGYTEFEADSQSNITIEEKETLAAKFLSKIGQKLDSMLADDNYIVNEGILTNYDRYQTRLQSIPDGEELVLLMTTENVILSEALIGLKDKDTLYISLFDFLSAVDFPIQINLDSQTASGWYISEDKTFYLDVSQSFVESGGEKFTIKDNDIINDGIDLLVRFDTLAQWFDLTLEPDLETMAIGVQSDIPLPVEARLMRDKRAGEFKYVSNRPVLPYKQEPYRLISEPFVDVQLGYTMTKSQDRDTTSLGRYSIIGANDLGYMSAKTYIQGSSNESLEDVRITLNRKAEEGETLGPLGIDEISLGDITPARMSIVSDGGQERGIRVSSNLGDADVSDTIQIQGDVQPGWDVELYRNDILIGIQQIDSSGRYDFQNVELFFGNNDFRIVFYGPQGQIREEIQSVPIFGNRLAQGKGAYDVSLTQRDEVTYQANALKTPDKGSLAFASRYEYGLTDNIMSHVGLRAWQRNKRNELLGVAGIQTNVNSFLYSLNTAVESDGGSAVEGIAQGLLGKNTVRFRQQFSTDDFDVDTAGSVVAVSQTEARLQGRLSDRTGFTIQGTHNIYNDNNQVSQVSTNIGTRIRRMSVNKEFSYTRDEYQADQDRFGGSLSLSGAYAGTHWRTRTNYDVIPDISVNSFLVSGLRSLNANLSAELQVENYLETDVTEGRLSFNYRNDHFILSPRISYDTDHDMRAYVSMNFGLGRDPYSGKSVMTRDRMTSSGAVSARAFLDENANGVYDQDEELLEGVSVLAKTNYVRGKTDETGMVFLPNLQEDRLTDITVDREKFADPFWIATDPGNSIKPRPGIVTRLDFPIAVAGEIDGVINIIGENKQERPARQMVVELMTSDRKVIKTEKTAYDGFYLFQDVLPGNYIINIPAQETDVRGLRSSHNHFVDVDPKGTVKTGANFVLYSSQLDDATVAELEEVNKSKEGSLMVLRLGSYNSSLLRMLKWVRLTKTHPEIFYGLRPQFDDEDDTKYLDIGPLYSANRADEICKQIQAIEEECEIRKAVFRSQVDMAAKE